MEVEHNFLDKVFNFLTILSSDDHCPVVCEAFSSWAFSPLSRVTQNKLDLNRLEGEKFKKKSCNSSTWHEFN